ncbi:hypothetical protein [Companilactobacillus jidongensis]|uniref:hypothetical protein n=1 Tax=Companilactobacillus jidongensis TaxID=2486006 RepID=UPI000F768D0A|nr:hypothetical protein [Companilactobacillus jidongensis]
MSKFAGMIIMMITFIPLTACYQNETKCTNDTKRIMDTRITKFEVTDTSIFDIIYTNIIFDLNDPNKGDNKLGDNSDIVIMRDKVFFQVGYRDINIQKNKHNNNLNRFGGEVGKNEKNLGSFGNSVGSRDTDQLQ